MITLRVECYAGYKGEETPRAFYIGETRFEVKEVMDRWLAPEHRYFKVICTEGSLYILRHDVQSGTWELTFFELKKRNKIVLE
ncbi:MAG TPA: hypothetical protein VGB26_06665 [Nitrospiria bacterium]|jgi:hypothetical protein